MSNIEEERKFKQCLDTMIELVRQTVNRLRHQDQSSHTIPKINTALNINIYTFTLDTVEEALMDELTTNLESIINEKLSTLSDQCQRYLLDFLSQYDYKSKARKFKDSFNIGILPQKCQ